MKYIVLIKPSGEITAEPVSEDNLLADLQTFVEGYVEVLKATPFSIYGIRQALIANEEGKLNALHYNPTATQIYGGDHIFGNAVIIRAKYDDIIGFESKEYAHRIITRLKYRLAQMLESHDDV